MRLLINNQKNLYFNRIIFPFIDWYYYLEKFKSKIKLLLIFSNIVNNCFRLLKLKIMDLKAILSHFSSIYILENDRLLK